MYAYNLYKGIKLFIKLLGKQIIFLIYFSYIFVYEENIKLCIYVYVLIITYILYKNLYSLV